MSSPRSSTEKDRTGHGHTGRYFGRPAATRLPNGDTAADFDGKTAYLQVKDAAALSPATGGVLTLEAWMRPDALKFPVEGNNMRYMHWMGKGEPNNHEYVARFYSNTDPQRPNRISGYQFNIDGGKGAGSYFQDTIRAGTWIHYVLVINAKAKSDSYPNGYVRIYRDGKLRDTTNLDYGGTVIVPKRGNAPFRIGTRDLDTFFEGAIGKVAIYGKELRPESIKKHYTVMTRR
ncbi:LamG domain-containing protein [Arthrobacter sp. E918]|uniref:LamG domain-containing protein n=2 Tax=Arthrobacter mobilis TaxID=2724944 RepID=A0A7X6HG96_9MICC|nr:LamG domain-containing protein [Arthrobacter mobilis]